MIKKIGFLTFLALSITQTVFAHEEGEYSSPAFIAMLLAIIVGFSALMWFLIARPQSFSMMEQAILILMATTGIVHLFIGLDGVWLLLINGAGYVGLLFLLFLPLDVLKPFRGYIELATLLYVAATFAGYFALHGINGHILEDWVALLTKVVELGLICLLAARLYSGSVGDAMRAKKLLN